MKINEHQWKLMKFNKKYETISKNYEHFEKSWKFMKKIWKIMKDYKTKWKKKKNIWKTLKIVKNYETWISENRILRRIRGAPREKSFKKTNKMKQIYKITRTGPIPGPDIRTGRGAFGVWCCANSPKATSLGFTISKAGCTFRVGGYRPDFDASGSRCLGGSGSRCLGGLVSWCLG